MTASNPYAPPETEVAPRTDDDGPTRGEVTFAEYETDLVHRLCTGMNVVGILSYVMGGAVALFVAGAFYVVTRLGRAMGAVGPSSGQTTVLWGVIVGATVMLGLTVMGGVWVQQAARLFKASTLAGETAKLAGGFRKLRAYLTLIGVVSLLGIAVQLVVLIARTGVK